MHIGSPILILLILYLGGGAVRADPFELDTRRLRLETIFHEECQRILPPSSVAEPLSQLERSFQRNLLYVRPIAFDQESAQLTRLRQQYVAALVKLAEQSMATEANARVVYQLLHQAAAFGSDRAAKRLGGIQGAKIVAARAQTNHPRLPWKRGEYWRITSNHFQIATNHSAEQGQRLAKTLEDLYSAWQQVFFDYWSDAAGLRTAWKRGRPLRPKSRKHRVVLFQSRDGYIQHLQAVQPRIGITLGFYDPRSETSYFFADADELQSTQLHEVTHQLFAETQVSHNGPRWQQNFWVIEGIAMYMESTRSAPFSVTVGGLDAHRLQFARFRRLQEQFYIPLSELVVMGQEQLQGAEQIRRIYSQSAGLAHFFMDGQQQKYRPALLRYLQLVYQGRDRPNSLTQLTGTPLAQLDEEYQLFLQVSDDDLQDARIRPHTVQSLCLGKTSVTDVGLRAIPPQSLLTWLDLAHTGVTNEGLNFALASNQLRQLNLEGTAISNALLEQLAKLRTLEELDLSHTSIGDSGLQSLDKLPNLQVLWLNGTRVSDDSIALLTMLPALQRLGITDTQISTAGRELLQSRRPDVVIP